MLNPMFNVHPRWGVFGVMVLDWLTDVYFWYKFCTYKLGNDIGAWLPYLCWMMLNLFLTIVLTRAVVQDSIHYLKIWFKVRIWSGIFSLLFYLVQYICFSVIKDSVTEDTLAGLSELMIDVILVLVKHSIFGYYIYAYYVELGGMPQLCGEVQYWVVNVDVIKKENRVGVGVKESAQPQPDNDGAEAEERPVFGEQEPSSLKLADQPTDYSPKVNNNDMTEHIVNA